MEVMLAHLPPNRPTDFPDSDDAVDGWSGSDGQGNSADRADQLTWVASNQTRVAGQRGLPELSRELHFGGRSISHHIRNRA